MAVSDSVQTLPSLARLPELAAGFDVSGLDEAGLLTVLADVRLAQRCLDGLVIRLGARSDELAATGRSAPSEETMRGAGSVGSRQARRESLRAGIVGSVPGLGDAASQGETTGENVDSVARHLSKLTDEQRDTIDHRDLVERATQMLPESFDRHLRRQVDLVIADHGLTDTVTKQAASEFRHWFDREAGMGRFSGSLDPERYEALTNAVEQCTAAIAARSDEPVTKNANLAAQALVELATSSGGRDARNRLPYVTVIVDHDTIVHGTHKRSVRQTETGHDLPPETVARLCCDAVIRRVTLDERGVPINVGRKYRTATDAQWAAIKAVYAGCVWGGCDAPINWCQAHHIREWETGGATDLENLLPLCSRHHHRVHEGRWHIKLLPVRTLKIYKPDGTHHTTVPTPQRC